ncbi:unnamed protein product [Rotaria sordida]|uniref:Uncharacterized protein n=2 Tax=Rotaria sordida TaxID=392033 RepID=A0A815JS91_9BILA|nr:unnamed protein product [Rotaria sordida]
MTNSGEDIEQDIDRCDDIVHEYGDDIDEDKDKNIEFHNTQRTIIEQKDQPNENDDTKKGEITDSGEDVEQDIDRCDDIFHEYGDDIDEDEDKNIEFDNLQRTIIEKKDESNENDHTKSIIPNDELHDNDSSGIFLDFTVDKDELCQKPSQLAASSKVKRTTHQQQSNEPKSRNRATLTPTTPTKVETDRKSSFCY